MTIEKFLHYWSQNNTMIIEGLIGLVILLSLFLAYRSFFGNKAEAGESHAGHGAVSIDAGQLEKTLQKILENQNLGSKLAANGDEFSVASVADVHSPAESTGEGGGAVSAEAAAEVAQLRATVADTAKKMEIMKAQLAEAQAQASSAANSAPADGAPGISSAERDELNNKLRDLEARLAEYEIISEDIADLSKYREENDDLKKQIEALKAAGAASPAPAAPAPAPVAATPPPVAAAPAEPVVEPPAAAAPEPAEPEPVLAVVPDPEPVAEPAATTDISSLIDDDLMKEFAAAVEGQKALDQAADKAGDGSAKATQTPDDTDKLMDQFENFVGNKKS